MHGLSPEEQAKKALRHVLEVIQSHPQVGYHLGLGTQTFSLLTEATAALFDEPVDHVRRFFTPKNPHA
jgi:hypothetical protein